MTEDEAREIVMERIRAHSAATQFSPEAIEAAVKRMMGEEPDPEPEEKVEEPKPSPFLAHTHGLHEKYFPDG